MCRRVVPCGRVFPRWASSANPAERRIYDILYKPGSHEVLYHTLQTFAWKIDAKAAINAFCSLARLDTARLVQMAEPGARPARGTGKLDTSLALEAEGGLAKRLDLLLKNREDLPPIHVSNLMWSLAKVAAREPFGSLTEAISKRLVAEVPKLTGRDLATSLWAVAVLVADTPHRQQIDKSLPVFLLQRVGLLAQSKDLKGYDLTQSLWAAAKLANLKVPGMVKLILELVRGALGEATTFECHSISVSLWSIGLTEELHDKEEIQQFAKELAAAGRLLVSSMNSQMLANSAWGAARVQVNDTSFYEALAVAGLDRRKTKDFTVMDQHIYNLAWSFVKAEVYNDATREFLLKAAADGRPGGRLQGMASYHLAGLAWVLAKAFTPDTLYENKDDTFTAPSAVANAITMAMQCARRQSDKFTPKELTWCVWAGARCKLQDGVLMLLPSTMQRLVNCEEEAEINAQNFSMLLWSIGATELGRPLFNPLLLGKFMDATMASMKADYTEAQHASHVCNNAWACAKADLPGSELIRLAITYVSEAKGPLEFHHYVMVAIARVSSPHHVSRTCARFVHHVYEESVQNFQRSSITDSWGDMQTNAENLALLRLCLVYLPQFYMHLRRPVRAFPEHLEQYRNLSITQSQFQLEVESYVKKAGVPQFFSESVVEGGLSLDILLPPLRDRGRKKERKHPTLP